MLCAPQAILSRSYLHRSSSHGHHGNRQGKAIIELLSDEKATLPRSFTYPLIRANGGSGRPCHTALDEYSNSIVCVYYFFFLDLDSGLNLYLYNDNDNDNNAIIITITVPHFSYSYIHIIVVCIYTNPLALSLSLLLLLLLLLYFGNNILLLLQSFACCFCAYIVPSA